MNLLTLGLLALVPWLVIAGAAIVWLPPRVLRLAPAGWRRSVVRLTLAVVLAPLVGFAWVRSCEVISQAAYTCLECGRTETQIRIASVCVSRKLEREHAEYAQRFARKLSAEHEHAWHLESCLWTETPCTSRVACTMETVEPWFRELPTLVDAAFAEQLSREAHRLPADERAAFMSEFGDAVAHRRADESVDTLAREWHAARQPVPLDVRVIGGATREPLVGVFVVVGGLEWQARGRFARYRPGELSGTATDAAGHAHVELPPNEVVPLLVVRGARAELARVTVDVATLARPSAARSAELEIVVP
ncbi:MAG: hypothetical protein L6Q99_18045 [Planctomycetes bacterium]|nr:hypothetical protein [Planctomycetota bacterium]